MARRWWVRGVAWSGVGLTVLIGLLLAALVLATQSAFGRERVRQITERIVGRYLLGSLRLGALTFGPGCTLAIDSAALRDRDDSLLASVGPTRASCQFGALVRGRLVVTSLAVARPYVVVRQLPSGVWNWSRAFRPDTSPPTPDDTVRGPASRVVDGPVGVTGGVLVLDVPWSPPDSLRGAARERAIAAALQTSTPAVRMVAGALVRRREFTGIIIGAPLIRTAVGDTTAIAHLNTFSVALSDPRLAVHRISGRVVIVGQAADAELPILAVGASLLHASGRVDWSTEGIPAIDARIVADTVALADVAPFVSRVPSTGGGAVRVAIHTAGGRSGTEYRFTAANLHTTQSAVRGDLTIRHDPSIGVTGS